MVYKHELDVIKGQLQESQQRLESLKNEKIEKEKRLGIMDEARILLEAVKTAKVKSKKDFILNIINTALADIFDYDIKIDIHSSDEDKDAIAGKQLKMRYNIILYENGIEIGRDEKLLSSNGGGILSVISILLKILTGYIYSKNKFYIFDETLAQVSAKYQERLSLFLKEFCDTYGFTIILITHNPELSTHAHMKYTLAANQLKNGLKSLKIDYYDGPLDLNEYYYIKVKNFQSIKDISLKFKGFVSITGANNIGKSALVRAINAIIFNTFNESYLRKGSKTSETEFGHVKDQKHSWVRMVYNGKVIYSFMDGTTLTGKRLAYDKIQEGIEKVGFKYLNVSKMYKNWKSDVKDQTDRLYVTTQHDKLYLIGGKSNDNDKLFNFLFNAESIAQAILNITYDERQLKTEVKELFNRIQDEESRINILTLKYEIAYRKYKKHLVEQYKNIVPKLKLYINSRNLINEFINKVNTLISNTERLNKLSNLTHHLETYIAYQLKVKQYLDFVSKIIFKIEYLIARKSLCDKYVQTIDNWKTHKKNREPAQDILNTVTRITEKIQTMITKKSISKRYFDILNSLEKLENGHQDLIAWFKDYETRVGIQTCPCCGGLGAIKTEGGNKYV